MSLQIYVGNYPTDFTREDVAKLFEDFEGVRLLRSLKKDKKCFSFLSCIDMDQVFDVVLTMNNVMVCGRNLIVRSTDDETQSYIQKTMEQLDESDETKNFVQDTSYLPSWVPLQNTSITEHSVNSSRRQFVDTQFKRNNENNNPPISKNRYYQYSQDSFDTGNSEFDAASSSISSNEQNWAYEPVGHFEKKCFYISVANFPIGTNTRDIYRLFSDFHPIKVMMKCNEARRDKTLTEAIVCFCNQEDATNAILNLDNTEFRGRVLLVNDHDDLSMTMELLGVASHN